MHIISNQIYCALEAMLLIGWSSAWLSVGGFVDFNQVFSKTVTFATQSSASLSISAFCSVKQSSQVTKLVLKHSMANSIINWLDSLTNQVSYITHQLCHMSSLTFRSII